METLGRSPHGERGLKCVPQVHLAVVQGRSPHGERGLKFGELGRVAVAERRSPHGERGLKFRHGEALVRDLVALLTESVD